MLERGCLRNSAMLALRLKPHGTWCAHTLGAWRPLPYHLLPAGVAAQPVGAVRKVAGAQLELETAEGPVDYAEALAACRSAVSVVWGSGMGTCCAGGPGCVWQRPQHSARLHTGFLEALSLACTEPQPRRLPRACRSWTACRAALTARPGITPPAPSTSTCPGEPAPAAAAGRRDPRCRRRRTRCCALARAPLSSAPAEAPAWPLAACPAPRRFEIEFFASLNTALQALGVTQPFEGGDLTQVCALLTAASVASPPPHLPISLLTPPAALLLLPRRWQKTPRATRCRA